MQIAIQDLYYDKNETQKSHYPAKCKKYIAS